MRAVNANGLTLHVSEFGDPNGPAVVGQSTSVFAE